MNSPDSDRSSEDPRRRRPEMVGQGGDRPEGRMPGGPGDRKGPSGPGGPGRMPPGGPGGAGPPSGPAGGGPKPPPPGLRSGLNEAVYFFRYVRPLLWMVGVSILFGLLASILRLPVVYVPLVLTRHFESGTWPVRERLTQMFGEGSNYLYAYLIIALSCVLIGAGFTWLRAYLSARLGECLLRVLRIDVFRKIEEVSMKAIYSSGAGEFIQRLTRDLFYVRDLFMRTLSEMLTLMLQVVVNIIALFMLEPGLTCLLIALFGVVVPIVRLVNRRVEGMARQMQRLAEQILGQLVESVGGYRDLRASGSFDRIAAKYQDLVRQAEKASVRTTIWAQSGGVFTHIVVSLLLIAPYMIYVGGLKEVGEVGRLVTYVALLGQVLPVFQQIARLTSDVALATPSMQKVRQLLEEHDPARLRAAEEGARYVAVHGEKPAAPAVIESIRLEGVSLELGNRLVVEDLTFTIAGGKLTALVGPSGSGKTTIFHLLLRLMEPCAGQLSINNIPLSAFDEKALRRTVGFIPQNPFIFNTSIRENLLIALPEGDSEDRLAEVIELAQLSPLIESRRASGGIESSAGYLGMSLSAGERQRVALARLLLQDPKVVICDEYTANIDSQTATLIKDMMDTRLADRTRVVITHELASIRDADHIVVLGEGRVVDQGTHDELMARGGLYRAMAEAQGE